MCYVLTLFFYTILPLLLIHPFLVQDTPEVIVKFKFILFQDDYQQQQQVQQQEAQGQHQWAKACWDQ